MSSPKQEIKVKTLLDFGLAKKLLAFPILNTRGRYQHIEVNVQTQPRIKMPRAKLKSSGTNAGKKATAITAALALVRLVVIPVLKGVALSTFSIFEKSNLEVFLESCINPWKLKNNRYATPTYFKIA